VTDEELRDAVVVALHESRPLYYEDAADEVIVPLAKRYAAEQLREAADWLWDDDFPTSDLCDHLRERADALTATEPEP
jgi:hypothetical protein